jgi:hypothetical protein
LWIAHHIIFWKVTDSYRHLRDKFGGLRETFSTAEFLLDRLWLLHK